jgi:hypothetical protein
VTLPAASGNAGKHIGFRMGSATALTKLVTIDGNASETIDGATTRIMWSEETAILLCDGSNWFKIAGKSIPMTVHLSRSTDQTGITGSAWTQIYFTTKDDGTDFLWDSANNRAKVVRPGKYVATVFCYANSASGQTGAYIALSVNSVAGPSPFGTYQQSASISFNAAGTQSDQLNLAANDYVVGLVYIINGSTNKLLGAAPATFSLAEIPQW